MGCHEVACPEASAAQLSLKRLHLARLFDGQAQEVGCLGAIAFFDTPCLVNETAYAVQRPYI
jgi:hypothetical protein